MLQKMVLKNCVKNGEENRDIKNVTLWEPQGMKKSHYKIITPNKSIWIPK